jgi:hypothetical protein
VSRADVPRGTQCWSPETRRLNDGQADGRREWVCKSRATRSTAIIGWSARRSSPVIGLVYEWSGRVEAVCLRTGDPGQWLRLRQRGWSRRYPTAS